MFYSVFTFNTGIFHVPQVHQRTTVMLWKFSAIMVQFLWLVKWSLSLLLCCVEENFVTLPWHQEDSCCLLIPVMKCKEQRNKSSSIQEWLERGRNYIWPLLKVLFSSKVRNYRSHQNNGLGKAPSHQQTPSSAVHFLGFWFGFRGFHHLDFSAYYPIQNCKS